MKPIKAEEAAVWEKKARKAMAVIALSVSPTEQERIIDCMTPKQAWDIFSKLYEGHGRNRKFMLLQELFQMSMSGFVGMDEYLRRVREKMSELAIIGTKLEDDVKLALILNGLSEQYRYLVVNLEQQEKIDFDELSARLIEEELKINGGAENGKMAMLARGNGQGSECHFCGQKGHWKKDCLVRQYREQKGGRKAFVKREDVQKDEGPFAM